MSVTVCVKGRDGVALASDSRRTFTENGPDTERDNTYWTIDNDMKVLPLGQYAVVTYAGSPGKLTLQDLVAEVNAALPASRPSVAEYAMHVSMALARRAALPSRWPFRPIITLAGIDPDGASRVYTIEAPSFVPEEQHVGALGIAYAGIRQVIDVLLHGFDCRLVVPDASDLFTTLALDSLSLEDCADLARSFVQITVDMVRFTGQYGFQGAGGLIDVAVIDGDKGFQYLAVKTGADQRIEKRQFVVEAPIPVISAPEDIGRLASYTIVPAAQHPSISKEGT